MMRLPWPFGVVGAALVFIILQIYLAFAPDTALSAAFRTPVKVSCYFIVALFLLAAFFSFVPGKIRGRRFRATQSLADIRSMSWKQFESITAEMFRQQGYFATETTEGPDNGVDLVLRKDGEKTYVQCKHWKANTVGVEKVRELLGSMAAGGAQAGIFVASGDYTQPAKDFARDCGITLIDGEQLARLLAGAQEESVHQGPTSDATVSCPLCSAQMVQRVAKRGRNKGAAFWGCSKYPQCRGTRQA
jgi:restriction system protein